MGNNFLELSKLERYKTNFDDFFPKTHVILDETIDPKTENYVRINDNNIEAGGKGSLEVLGNLGKLKVNGDFTIQWL